MTRYRNPDSSHIGSTQPCKVCGTSFLKDHGRRVTCSFACQKIARDPVIQTRCAWCDKAVTQVARDSKRGLQATCSSPCRGALAMVAKGFVSSQWLPPKPVRERTIWPSCWIQIGVCQSCGEPFTSRYTAKTCSTECARKNRRKISREGHRAHGHHYEHLRRSRTVVAPDGIINWRRVRTRDGAACYLCGYDTNANDYMMRLGSNGRQAFIVGLEYPSLDHVIPLSKGGAHSMSNSRLAHTYCNSIKSDQMSA